MYIGKFLAPDSIVRQTEGVDMLRMFRDMYRYVFIRCLVTTNNSCMPAKSTVFLTDIVIFTAMQLLQILCNARQIQIYTTVCALHI